MQGMLALRVVILHSSCYLPLAVYATGSNVTQWLAISLLALRIKRLWRTAGDRSVLSHSCPGGTKGHKQL
jgi:hypothetical protein